MARGASATSTASARLKPTLGHANREAESLTLQLKRTEARLREALHPTLIEYGLLFEHWQILAVLQEQPGLRMSDLASEAVLPPATVTRYVDRLVERALVIRRIDPQDRRAAIVALSQRGARLAEALSAIEGATVTVDRQ